mgnify:CR=1 FL=1
MAAENINEILGIEEPVSQSNQSHGIFDNGSEDHNNVEPNSASKGLIKASNVCQTFMWLGIVLAIIGTLVFLANIGDAMEGYSWSAKYQARCEGGISCVIYGIADAIFSYVFSKILIGLSVMTKASELYLKGKE